MKKFFIIALFLFISNASFAQLFSGESIENQPNVDNKRWSWGYFLGFNSYDFDFDYIDYNPSTVTGKDYLVETRTGFNVGLTGSRKWFEGSFGWRSRPWKSWDDHQALRLVRDHRSYMFQRYGRLF